MSMLFTINNSPFFGKDGKFVTSRHIFDRLQKELDKNLALRVVPTDFDPDWWTELDFNLHFFYGEYRKKDFP